MSAPALRARRRAALLATGVLMGLSGCATTYWFHTPGAAVATPNGMPLSEQLQVVLAAEGFKLLGATPVLPAGIGCGQPVSDQQTFQKQWPEGPLFGPRQTVVWVYEFTCNQQWYAVIASSGLHDRADELRDVLADRFAKQLKAGTVVVETKRTTGR